MSKVICLQTIRNLKTAEHRDSAYQMKIQGMDKIELLEEMMRFQEERTKEGKLTFQLMIRGKTLFKALESQAETEELRSLAHSYQRHLKLELEGFLSSHRKSNEG